MKHWKAVIYVIVMLAFLMTSVMGWVWTDYAKTPFWWTFWVVAALVSLVAFVAGIFWLGKSDRKW